MPFSIEQVIEDLTRDFSERFECTFTHKLTRCGDDAQWWVRFDPSKAIQPHVQVEVRTNVHETDPVPRLLQSVRLNGRLHHCGLITAVVVNVCPRWVRFNYPVDPGNVPLDSLLIHLALVPPPSEEPVVDPKSHWAHLNEDDS